MSTYPHYIRGCAVAPTPLIGRNSGSWYPERSWKESGWGGDSPLMRAFTGSKLHARTILPPPPMLYCTSTTLALS